MEERFPFKFEDYKHLETIPFRDAKGKADVLEDSDGNQLFVVEGKYRSGLVAVNRRAYIEWVNMSQDNVRGRRGLYFICSRPGQPQRQAMVSLTDWRPDWKTTGDSQYALQDLTLIPAAPPLPGATPGGGK